MLFPSFSPFLSFSFLLHFLFFPFIIPFLLFLLLFVRSLLLLLQQSFLPPHKDIKSCLLLFLLCVFSGPYLELWRRFSGQKKRVAGHASHSHLHIYTCTSTYASNLQKVACAGSPPLSNHPLKGKRRERAFWVALQWCKWELGPYSPTLSYHHLLFLEGRLTRGAAQSTFHRC